MKLTHCLFYVVLGIALFQMHGFAEAEERQSKSTDPIKVAGVPSGFQFLLEKQTTAIDVFYGDVYLTTTLASYTPSTVEFHNPDEVVTQLKNLLTPDQIARNLSGEIDSHAGEVCYRDGETDCGVISPDTVGVIFDEGKFRADIFINPNLLSVQQRDANRYLPASTSAFSSVNNFAVIYSGSQDGQDAATLNAQNLISFEQQRIITNWNYLDTNGVEQFNVQNLYWQMDEADFQYQAGWFDSDSRFLNFVSNFDLLGARYSTSLKVRTDLNFNSGSTIQLYLPTRSRINIYKDGQFLSTAFYNPGNQLLDTTALPDGAYDIELRIVDSSGQEERVSRFFVKTQRLAPEDQDLYFFELGDIRQYVPQSHLPEAVGLAVAQGGYSHRLTERLGINTGLSATEKEAISEFGLYWVDERFELEPRLMIGAKGEYGWSFSGYARFFDWTSSYQTRRVWTDNLRTVNDFHLIASSLSQDVVSIGRPLFEGFLQFRYNRFDRQDAFATETGSIIYQKPFVFSSGRYNFYSEYTRSRQDSLIMLGIDWSWRGQSTYHSVGVDATRFNDEVSGRDDYLRAGYSGYWVDDEWRPEDIAVNWSAQADHNYENTGVDTAIKSDRGAFDLGLNYKNDNLGGENFLYGGQLSTTVANERNVWAVGGKAPSQGALIIDISTDFESKQSYPLYINGMHYGDVRANQRLVVPVAPYQVYTVKIEDKGTEFVSFKNAVQTVAIYPGNVKSLTWSARGVGVLVAKIITKKPDCFNDLDESCWQPLVNARATGVNDVAITDADGFIQTEVFTSSTSITLIKKGGECRIDLSALKFINGIAYPEQDLPCISYKPDTP